jgi:hypothetical protein
VVIGPPIAPAEVTALADEDLLAELEQRILTCHAVARELRRGVTCAASGKEI